MFKRFLFVLLAAGLLGIFFFDGLGVLGLLTPDEPRYAAIAREMARSGDWITPRLWGEAWFEKPPLYYWLAAVSMRLIGRSEMAARLPSACLAALLWIATWWVTGRLFGKPSGAFAFLLGISSLGMIVFSHGASTDMPFTATFGLAMLCLCVWLFDPVRAGRRRWLLAFYVFLALATLAKGPVSIILSGGSFLLWTAATRKWSLLRPLLHPLGILTFLLISLPWFLVSALLSGGSFLYTFFVYHNWIRYLEPVFRHPQPFWFFWAVLPAAIFPWTLLVLFPVHRFYRWIRLGEKTASAWPFFACWVFFPVLFFSFSQSKLPGYILPCVPPLVALIASELVPPSSASRIAKVAALSGGITLAGVLFATPSVLARFSAPLKLSHLAGLGVVLFVGVIASLLLLYRYPRGATPDKQPTEAQSRTTLALLALVLVESGMVLYLNRGVLPLLDPSLSARQLAHSIRTTAPEMALYLAEDLPHSWQFGLEYYLDTKLPRLPASRPAEATRLRVVCTKGTLPSLPSRGWRITDAREVVPPERIYVVEAVASPAVGGVSAPAGLWEGSQGKKLSPGARTPVSPRPSR